MRLWADGWLLGQRWSGGVVQASKQASIGGVLGLAMNESCGDAEILEQKTGDMWHDWTGMEDVSGGERELRSWEGRDFCWLV